MQFNKINWMTLVVALCFAILQALQPFIHGHLDSEHPIQHTGFHVGDEFEEAVVVHVEAEDLNAEHTITSTPHSSHTVSVGSSIKQDIEPILTSAIVGLMLVAIFLAINLPVFTVSFSRFSSFPYQSLRRRLPAPRAPPQY